MILPANTFIATAEAVVRARRPAGARRRATPTHLLIDPGRGRRGRVTDRTRAVIPVAPLRPGRADGAAAGGARGARHRGRRGRRAVPGRHAARPVGGPFGAVAATSFYPGKNLGAYGDAGAVITDDDGLAGRVRLLGAHGSPAKYEHDAVGFNSRLDTLQAVVLRAKLRRLAQLERAAPGRRRPLRRSCSRASPGVRLPGHAAGQRARLAPVRRPGRRTATSVLRRLHADGHRRRHPLPDPGAPHAGAMRGLGYGAGSFPVAERAAGEILSLPLFPGIT